MDSYGHIRFSGEIPGGEIPEIPGRSQASSPVDQTAKLFEPGIEGLVALAQDTLRCHQTWLENGPSISDFPGPRNLN